MTWPISGTRGQKYWTEDKWVIGLTSVTWRISAWDKRSEAQQISGSGAWPDLYLRSMHVINRHSINKIRLLLMVKSVRKSFEEAMFAGKTYMCKDLFH